MPAVPPQLLGVLAAKADERRLLPVWTDWWDEREVAQLFPDPATRARVEAQQRRIPLSYFEETVRVAPGWAGRPCAYLAFGDTYRAEAEAAGRRGWPVRVLAGEHLEMVVHPEAVAAAVVSLLADATTGRHPAC